jgi:hypothetical protein
MNQEKNKNNGYVYINVQHIPIEEYDRPTDQDFFFDLDFEFLIFNLSSYEEIQLLLLRYLGYNYTEAVDIMNLKDVNEYYKIYRSLRKHVKKIQEK